MYPDRAFGATQHASDFSRGHILKISEDEGGPLIHTDLSQRLLNLLLNESFVLSLLSRLLIDLQCFDMRFVHVWMTPLPGPFPVEVDCRVGRDGIQPGGK